MEGTPAEELLARSIGKAFVLQPRGLEFLLGAPLFILLFFGMFVCAHMNVSSRVGVHSCVGVHAHMYAHGSGAQKSALSISFNCFLFLY